MAAREHSAPAPETATVQPFNTNIARQALIGVALALPFIGVSQATAEQMAWRTFIQAMSRTPNGRAAALLAYEHRDVIDIAKLDHIVQHEPGRDPRDLPRIQFGRWEHRRVYNVTPRDVWDFPLAPRAAGTLTGVSLILSGPFAVPDLPLRRYPTRMVAEGLAVCPLIPKAVDLPWLAHLAASTGVPGPASLVVHLTESPYNLKI